MVPSKNMRVVFINPSLRPEAKRRQLPVGLAYIMTAARKAGFGFDLIDMDINQMSMDSLKEVLTKQTYDVYALGCIVTGFRYVRQICEIIKEWNPNGIIIAGNSVATSVPELLLENTKVDIAVLGEGDITFVELLRQIQTSGDISSVEGIAYLEDGRTHFTQNRKVAQALEQFGFPEWDIFELEKYRVYSTVNINVFGKGEVLSFPLNSARGCPFNCTFCYHVFKGERYRRYTVDAIISEIERLHYKYECDFISFWDELTFPNATAVSTFVDRMEKLDFEVNWEAPIRGDLFKKNHLELLKRLKNVGCDSLSFSLENASPEILRTMNKKLTLDQFLEQAEVINQTGIVPLTSVVFGYPEETPESIRLTVDVCRKTGMYPSVGYLLPLPGTPIYEWAKEHGFINDEVEYLERIGDRQDFHINLTTMDDQEFMGTVESELAQLAKEMGLDLQSLFKTTTYQKPKTSKY